MNIRKIIKEELDDFDWADTPNYIPIEDFISCKVCDGDYVRVTRRVETNYTPLKYTPNEGGENILENGEYEIYRNNMGHSNSQWIELVGPKDVQGIQMYSFFVDKSEMDGFWFEQIPSPYDEEEEQLWNGNYVTESNDFDWVEDVKIPDVSDADKYRVLVDILSYTDVFGDGEMDEGDFEENSWNHYGEITTFTLDNGQEWAVGTIDEFDNALRIYWDDYADNHGHENIYNIEEYLRMSETDRRMFASEMADSYVDDMDDDDLIDTADLGSEMGEIQEKIDDLEILLRQTEDEERMEVIRGEHQVLESEKEELYDTAREAIRSSDYDDWYECLEDPYECLVNQHGIYSDAGDLLESNSIFFDNEVFVDDMMNSSDYGELAHYDGEYHEEGDYIAVRVD